MIHRTTAFAAAITLCFTIPAGAQGWPHKQPVRIIAPSSAGGGADTNARMLADYFSETFKAQFVVENRGGAGGLIGAAAVARAEPDGYTLVISSVGYHAIAPAASPNPGFDPLKDFSHIAYLGGAPNALVVHPSLGARSLKEFLVLGRKGAPIAYVSAGVGSHGQLVSEYFAEIAGLKLQHIPYRGATPAMTDLIAGTVKVGTMSFAAALGQINAGRVLPLAVTSSARLQAFPDLPTFKEHGFDSLVTLTWFALSGPAGMPADIVARLNEAAIRMQNRPDIRSRLDRDAIETVPMTPAEFTRHMASEIAKWGPIAKRIVPPG
jgi:tripartite-type tricarboxylate transporter receptor subunit TctC